MRIVFLNTCETHIFTRYTYNNKVVFVFEKFSINFEFLFAQISQN